MTTPTREQVIAAPIESYSAEDRAFFAFWYAHMKDDLMQPPLHECSHAVARHIFTAGREQGLREAKEVCEQNAKRWPDLRGFYVANECAAAIEQLRGK